MGLRRERKLAELLQRALDGLQWYRDACPDLDSEADNEYFKEAEEVFIPESALKRPFKPEPGRRYAFSNPELKRGPRKSFFRYMEDGFFVDMNYNYYTHCRELTLDEWAEIGAPVGEQNGRNKMSNDWIKTIQRPELPDDTLLELKVRNRSGHDFICRNLMQNIKWEFDPVWENLILAYRVVPQESTSAPQEVPLNNCRSVNSTWISELYQDERKILIMLAVSLKLPAIAEYESEVHFLNDVYSRILEARNTIYQLNKLFCQ